MAFEGYEHKHLGDLAVRIAIDYTQVAKLNDSLKEFYWTTPFEERCKDLDPGVRSFYRTRSSSVCPGVESDAPTYGDLVKLVDYMSYPQQLFESSRDQIAVGIPKDFTQLNQRVISERNKEMTQSLAHAATGNVSHFQAGLVNLLVQEHGKAVDLAHRGDMFAALVANSQADHFLHDFFAPGHITTARENSHDAVALGMHDTVNRLGASFKINQARWNADLVPILGFIYRNHRADRGDYNLSLGKTRYTEIEIDQTIEGLERGHEGIEVFGDNLLHTNPHQQLVMLLVEVRALQDVLDANSNGADSQHHRRNSLNEYLWTEYNDNRRDEKPKAGIAYGEYDIDVELMSRASSILMFAVGGEAPVSGFSSSRLFLSAEIVPLKLIGESDFLRKHTINKPTQECPIFSVCNMAPVIGLTAIRDDNFSALGPNLRIIKAFPKLGTQISVYYQYLKYDFQTSESKSSYGARLDIGFSIYSAFVAIGEGYFVDGTQQLQSDHIVTFGLAVGLPFSRMGLPW